MVSIYLLGLAAFIAVQRSVELRMAERNRHWALGQGAREFGRAHYSLFFLLHAGWLAGWVGEGIYYNQLSGYWYVWLGLFMSAQGLRYWCIISLGSNWNTRILVIPGAKAVERGPYRYLRHPNYLAVAIELACVPMIFGAVFTAGVATVLNACLLLGIRIPEEERALRELS